jgi:hypothetical protein
MIAPLPAERCRDILDYAKASYVSESLYNDPGLTKGIDNVLLLLLRLVLQVIAEGECLQDNVGLHAGDRLRALLQQHERLPRSVRRWLADHAMLFVQLAENMVEALKHQEVPEVPAGPVHGFPRFVRVEGPSEPQPVFLKVASSKDGNVEVPFGRGQLVGTWKMVGFVEQPLPDWWHGLNRRRPARAAVYLDGVAHKILSKDAD